MSTANRRSAAARVAKKHQRPSVRRKARCFGVEATSEIRFAGIVSGATASLGAGRSLNHLNHQLRFDLNFGSIVLVKWSTKGTFDLKSRIQESTE
jgi:hypothetical protein